MAVKTRVNVRAWSETTPGGTEYYIDGNKILGIGATIPLATLADFTRGDLIVGGAVQWQDLAHPGAAGRVLTTDATDTLWGTYALTGTTGGTTHLAVTNTKTLTLTAADSYNLTAAKTGTLPVGTGTAGRIAEWVTDANTLQASTLIKSGAGVLTLTAGGAYTVKVNGICTLNDWFDQSVKKKATPTFASVIMPDAGYIGNSASSARLVFDSSGAQDYTYIRASRVVVNTGTPIGAQLDIAASGVVGIFIERDAGASSIKAGPTDGYMMIDSNGKQLRLNNYVTDNIILCNGGGSVGIGTTSPDSRLDIAAGAITMAEMTEPSAPAANGVVIYAADNRFGKTRLMALFATGAAQQIAIQP